MKSYDFIIEFLAYEMPLGNNLVCFHVRPLLSSLRFGRVSLRSSYSLTIRAAGGRDGLRSLRARARPPAGKGGERRVNRDEPDREADVITGRGTISERDEPREKDAERLLLPAFYSLTQHKIFQ